MYRCTLCAHLIGASSVTCDLRSCQHKPHHMGCMPHRAGKVGWGDGEQGPFTWQGFLAVLLIVGAMLVAGLVDHP